MAHNTQDDGFHEIQLNGKQLVFLFMAATVVSVVIFLCGVLVGRGVRAERSAAADAVSLNAGPSVDAPPAVPAGAPVPAPAGSDPTAAVPPPAIDDLSYFNRLEKQNQPAEDLKLAPAAASATPVSADARPAVAAPTAKEPARPAAAPAAQGPAAPGYAVQIAALNVRGEADAIAKRLASKGYAAYVVAPPSGSAPAVYRVRVGTFKTRREAETVAAVLEKEEQFKPWVTR